MREISGQNRGHGFAGVCVRSIFFTGNGCPSHVRGSEAVCVCVKPPLSLVRVANVAAAAIAIATAMFQVPCDRDDR